LHPPSRLTASVRLDAFLKGGLLVID